MANAFKCDYCGLLNAGNDKREVAVNVNLKCSRVLFRVLVCATNIEKSPELCIDCFRHILREAVLEVS